MNDNTRKLREFLKDLQPGPVPKDLQGNLKILIALYWDNLSGSKDCAMATYKVERMEDPNWNPPIFTFIIERHGATVLGSTRAERQLWELNVDIGEASFRSVGYRQLLPRAAPWKAAPVAMELAQLILSGKDDPRLKWSTKEKNRVIVQTSSIIPECHSSSKETASGRRRSLFMAMEKLLAPAAWKRTGNLWEKSI